MVSWAKKECGCFRSLEHKASSLQPHKKPLEHTALQEKNQKPCDDNTYKFPINMHKAQKILKISQQSYRSKMATEQLKSVAVLLLFVNVCMYTIVVGIGGWAINKAIDHGFTIGQGFDLPPHFSPIYFPMGNAATGFFVVFALIAGVVGVASAISGLNHIRHWDYESLPAAASAATIAWTLTLLAMGFACKQIDLHVRTTRLRILEAVIIILSATQLFYVAAIHGAASRRRV